MEHVSGEKRSRDEISTVGAYQPTPQFESDTEEALDLPPPPLAAGLCEVDGVVLSDTMAKLVPSNVAATTLVISVSNTSSVLPTKANVEEFFNQFGSFSLSQSTGNDQEYIAVFTSKAGAVKAFIASHPHVVLPVGANINSKWQIETDPVSQIAISDYATAPPELEKLPYGLLPTITIYPQDEKAPLAFTYAYLYTVFARYRPYNINMTPDKKAVYCSVHSDEDATKAVEQLSPIFGPRGYNVAKTLM